MSNKLCVTLPLQHEIENLIDILLKKRPLAKAPYKILPHMEELSK